MRILVIGAGAVGSVLGGFLAKEGHAVTLLGREAHMRAIRADGLAVHGFWGSHRVDSIEASADENVSRRGPWDWLFVCVKTHQTAAIRPLVAAAASGNTRVCIFQNGVEQIERIGDAVAPDKLALARVIFGAEIVEPGKVRVTGSGGPVLIGSSAATATPPWIETLVDALARSGVPAQATRSIRRVLWAKLTYNCALNGLAALLGVPYGALLDSPVTQEWMERIVREVYAAAQAMPFELEPSAADAYIDKLFHELIPSTAAHHPSMFQDIRHGRPTEINALNGFVVRSGISRGVPTAANALVLRLVREAERRAGINGAD